MVEKFQKWTIKESTVSQMLDDQKLYNVGWSEIVLSLASVYSQGRYMSSLSNVDCGFSFVYAGLCNSFSLRANLLGADIATCSHVLVQQHASWPWLAICCLTWPFHLQPLLFQFFCFSLIIHLSAISFSRGTFWSHTHFFWLYLMCWYHFNCCVWTTLRLSCNQSSSSFCL